MHNIHLILLQLHSSAYQPRIVVLHSPQPLQSHVVSLQRETSTMHIRTESVHCPLHAKALNLRSCVTRLRWLQTTARISNRSLLITFALQQTRTQTSVRRISSNGKLLGEVRHLENRRCQ